MSMWAGTCQLVAEKQARDERGVASSKRLRRQVPCNVYSISAAAYYAASAAGIRPQAIIELRSCAYRNETLVEIDGALLAVARVERMSDNVRLTLVERVSNRERGK